MTHFIHFNDLTFDETLANCWEQHEFYNSGILSVFEHDPDHRDFAKTEVKILLLDKAYSAGLRRWVRRCPDSAPLPKCDAVEKACNCPPMDIFIRHLQQPRHAEKLSEIMRSARDLGPTLTADNLRHVIKYHADFVTLLSERIRRPESSDAPANALSFFSKYLWFHAGIFPVLDSLARNGLRKLQGRGAPRYDNYAGYCEDIFALLKVAFGKDTFDRNDVKKLDCFLVELGAGRIP